VSRRSEIDGAGVERRKERAGWSRIPSVIGIRGIRNKAADYVGINPRNRTHVYYSTVEALS
jgi:hypothetical protein